MDSIRGNVCIPSCTHNREPRSLLNPDVYTFALSVFNFSPSSTSPSRFYGNVGTAFDELQNPGNSIDKLNMHSLEVFKEALTMLYQKISSSECKEYLVKIMGVNDEKVITMHRQKVCGDALAKVSSRINELGGYSMFAASAGGGRC